MLYYISEATKQYSLTDMTSYLTQMRTQREQNIQNGTSDEDRVFVENGKDRIPLYSDDSEYEYYEFQIDHSYEDTKSLNIERYFYKDQEMFAIYTKHILNSIETEETLIIKEITYEIPEGMLSEPDLTGYKEFK